MQIDLCVIFKLQVVRKRSSQALKGLKTNWVTLFGKLNRQNNMRIAGSCTPPARNRSN